jgi:methylmalonyl-CoA mutase C-terminal domain/subunit
MGKRKRILVAKVGCDIHERGALTLLHVCRDAGFEVIYTGRYQSEEGVAQTAVTEDIDVVAVSDLTGSMVIICRKIIEELRRLEAADLPVICGGLITDDDAAELKAMGVKGCFATGSPVEETLGCLNELFAGQA